jgi:hypothetical protein
MTQPLALLRKYRGIYLATPYSLHRGGPELAFAEACQVAGDLIAEGVKVFSPIAHSHPICDHSDLDPLDHDLWLDQDEFFMEACEALLVAQFIGWEDSYGIAEEVRWFRDNKKPIHYLDPIKMELR